MAHITDREAIRLMSDNFNESKLLRTMAKGVIEQRNETNKANLERDTISPAKDIRVRPETAGTNEMVQVDSPLWFVKSPAILMMAIIALMFLSVSYCGGLAVEKEVKADAVDLSLPMKKVIQNLEQE